MNEHVHHWRLSERDGTRFSSGVCVTCGEQSTFDNWALEDRAMNWKERGEIVKGRKKAKVSSWARKVKAS